MNAEGKNRNIRDKIKGGENTEEIEVNMTRWDGITSRIQLLIVK